MMATRSMCFYFVLLTTWLFAPFSWAQQSGSDSAETIDVAPESNAVVDLQHIISAAVEEHDRLLGARADADGLRETARETLGAWFPSLDLTAAAIRETIDREGADPVLLPSQEITLTITQLLWDFGATNGTVESARLAHVQSEIAFFRTRQELIVEAVQAYANLLRSVDVLAFARQSEENIRIQTGLEEVRITAGSGLTTDLLQAKTQLAGAQARRVDAEGALDLALNRYRAVYGDVPGNMDNLPAVEMDRSSLPSDLEGVLALAFERNPEIREAAIAIAISKQDRRATYSDFLPTLDVVGETKALDNDGGATGTRTESSIKVELSWPFNLGFTAINTLRSGQSAITSSSRALADLRRSLEERVRNAWKQLETAQIRSQFLFDQAAIARAFLDVAKEERKLGQRSLIDVLSGETALINAQSDAVSAETEVALAALELLAATGALSYQHIMERDRPERAVEIERDEDLGPDLGGGEGTVFDPSVLGGIADDEGTELDPNVIFQPPPGSVDDEELNVPEIEGLPPAESSVFDAPDDTEQTNDMPADTLPLGDGTDVDSFGDESLPPPAPANDALPTPTIESDSPPEPEAAPEIVPTPTPEPAPEPVPEPAPAPEPEVVPALEAVTDPAPEQNSNPELVPESAPESGLEAGAQPAPSESGGEEGLPELFQESLEGETSFDVNEPPSVPDAVEGDDEGDLESPLLKWAQ